jgi:hypothetical protein
VLQRANVFGMHLVSEKLCFADLDQCYCFIRILFVLLYLLLACVLWYCLSNRQIPVGWWFSTSFLWYCFPFHISSSNFLGSSHGIRLVAYVTRHFWKPVMLLCISYLRLPSNVWICLIYTTFRYLFVLTSLDIWLPLYYYNIISYINILNI